MRSPGLLRVRGIVAGLYLCLLLALPASADQADGAADQERPATESGVAESAPAEDASVPEEQAEPAEEPQAPAEAAAAGPEDNSDANASIITSPEAEHGNELTASADSDEGHEGAGTATGAIERMEALTEELAPAEPEEPAYVPPRDQVTEYLRAIDRTEAMTNAYSTELADLYLGLGQSLLDKREYDSAKEAFQQGMQIVRVNYGLNSPEQSNYLFAIANIESTLGNSKVVDQVMENIYLINARNYGEKSAEMIPVLDRMLGWYMRNRPLEHEDSRFADMERAELLAGRKAAIVEEHYGLGHPETASVYRQMGQISWQTARYVLSRGMSIERGLVVAVGSPPQNPNARAISIKSLVSSGEAAFAKVAASVNSDDSRSALEKAEAVSQLGDWNLAFGKRRTAGDLYEQAHRILADDPVYRHYADEYFDVPTPVRFMQEDLLPVDPGQVASDNVLAVHMTVTEGGRPLDVEIIDAPESFPADHVRLMKRMVSEMRFRPRLVKGTPEKIENFVWYLSLDDPEWLP
ncbi:MAG: tetratricopeptide repeat protein [Xanthomonadales bacterium]|nr:tetratricopeptide repeat protein [Xanthomonadales bacterium]